MATSLRSINGASLSDQLDLSGVLHVARRFISGRFGISIRFGFSGRSDRREVGFIPSIPGSERFSGPLIICCYCDFFIT